jgi:hypothetical protein
MSRQDRLDVIYLAGGNVALEHREHGARCVLRIERGNVIQFGCDSREKLLLVTQSFGLSGGMVSLIIVETADQNRQLGAELCHLVHSEPIAQNNAARRRARGRPSGDLTR